MPTTTKKPYEVFPLSVDFQDVLATGETISTAAASSVLLGGYAEESSSLVSASAPTIDGTTVLFSIQGGADGQTHLVRVQITTSDGNKYQEDITVVVQEPA